MYTLSVYTGLGLSCVCTILMAKLTSYACVRALLWFSKTKTKHHKHPQTTFNPRRYPVAVDPADAGAGWVIDAANGSVTNTGLCLTANGNDIDMEDCGGTGKAAVQQWTLETNGNLNLRSRTGKCLALKGGSGPATTLAECKSGSAGANEEFTLVGGKLCSNKLNLAVGVRAREAICLLGGRLEREDTAGWGRSSSPPRPPPSYTRGAKHAASVISRGPHSTLWDYSDVRRTDDSLTRRRRPASR